MSLSAAQARGRIKNIAAKNGADPRVLMRIARVAELIRDCQEIPRTVRQRGTIEER